ncbi:M81 family metallopeptidase [Tropicibacter sp. Alg240-R139]|uniref:M81 family metallopeptidase n=1 Tax=Tropicibacter sp. Alg240-R139 TaxID=2305991 RepID=UPI0013DFF488|nr:M81 family metallopeptidase [Tropicibacter sp. Alg240-R139]
MKLLIAGLATETNTFSPIPTGRLSFEQAMVTRTATEQPGNLFSAPLIEWRTAAEAHGWQVIESLTAVAQPAGPTVREVYEGYRDEILADLETHRPDIFLISMHGAMVADGYDDCEGDLTERARAILGGRAVIGLELDPHNHLTEKMISNATLIVSYKEYPHVDSPDRARELFQMAANTATGKVNPVMAMADCRMLTIIETMKEPGQGFVQAMKDAEGMDGVLSVSLTHGFPWADVADVGARMLVITDGDTTKATDTAERFAADLWSIREGLRGVYPDTATALDRVDRATQFPVVLADMADNAGGGAPSDSTYFLQEALDRGTKDIAFALFWEPVLISMCQNAGVGATMRVRLGGKICAFSGHPIDLTVTVRAIRENMSMKLGDTEMEMGTGVWLEADGVHVILSSERTQCFNPTAFTDLGLDITQMRALVVKSTNHFYAAFAPIASEVVHVRGPGIVTPDMTIIPFTKRDTNYWPRVENPFAAVAK